MIGEVDVPIAALVVASDLVPPRPKTGNRQGRKERQELA